LLQTRNASQAAAAASVAATKPVKNKKFLIYRWNPEKPGDKPTMKVTITVYLSTSVFNYALDAEERFCYSLAQEH
jgi:hypothetical protein